MGDEESFIEGTRLQLREVTKFFDIAQKKGGSCPDLQDPFLVENLQDAKDSWGQKISASRAMTCNGFELTSMGPDGVPSSDDDISLKWCCSSNP